MSIAHKILKSSVWVYAANWFTKIIGLVSTLILARLLTPDDFGVVASVAIVTSLFHVLTTTNTNGYLLRKKVISNDDLNTAWTISIVMKFLVSVFMLLLASTIADFLDDPRIASVLHISAFIPLLASFSNIGMVRFEKEMQYKPEFKLNLYVQFIAFFCRITLAIIYQNYWAFVIAELVSVLVRVIGSYFSHSFRPSFSLKNWREQWAFSQWILARGIFSTIRFKIDNIVIAKFFPATALGMYTVAKEIATTPAGQIVGPMMQPLYVGLAEYIHEPLVFADKVHKTILSALIIAFPIAFGISALAENIVEVMLGEQWLAAIAIIQIVAFIILSGVVNTLITHILNVLGKVKAAFKLDIIIGVVTIITFLLLAKHLTLNQFALVRVLLGFFSFLVVITYVRLVTKIKLLRLVLLVLPILLCASVMYLSVTYLPVSIILENKIIQLVILILTGALVYAGLCYLAVKILKNYLHEYDFVWKTMVLPIVKKQNRI